MLASWHAWLDTLISGRPTLMPPNPQTNRSERQHVPRSQGDQLQALEEMQQIPLKVGVSDGLVSRFGVV